MVLNPIGYFDTIHKSLGPLFALRHGFRFREKGLGMAKALVVEGRWTCTRMRRNPTCTARAIGESFSSICRQQAVVATELAIAFRI